MSNKRSKETMLETLAAASDELGLDTTPKTEVKPDDDQTELMAEIDPSGEDADSTIASNMRPFRYRPSGAVKLILANVMTATGMTASDVVTIALFALQEAEPAVIREAIAAHNVSLADALYLALK